MNVELTLQDMKRIESIKKLLGRSGTTTEPDVWMIVSHALIQYERELEKKREALKNVQVGDLVKWTSQANGNAKEKRGKIVARVEKGDDGWKALRAIVPKFSDSQVKFKGYNMVSDRYIVEVPRGGKSKLMDYYAPPVSWVQLDGESHG